jgi:ABC-type transporter Mla subunit MlaD
MPRLTPRDKMRAWRDKYLDDVARASAEISAMTSEAKKLKARLGRTIDGLVRSSESIKNALSQGIEDRHDEIMEALIRKHGREAAEVAFDEVDTSRDDERDEATCGQIDDLSFPDPDDDLTQAIESLENLGETTRTLLADIRAIS